MAYLIAGRNGNSPIPPRRPQIQHCKIQILQYLHSELNAIFLYYLRCLLTLQKEGSHGSKEGSKKGCEKGCKEGQCLQMRGLWTSCNSG